MFFGEGNSLRQELRKHLRNEYYRFAREVAPTHFCYEEIADAIERVARRESLVKRIPFRPVQCGGAALSDGPRRTRLK
jgi:hypothetical protein